MSRRPQSKTRTVEVMVAGATGRVGSALLRQLAARGAAIAAETGVTLRLVAAGSRAGFVLCAQAVAGATAERLLRAADDRSGGLDALLDWVEERRPSAALFVDCTGAAAMAARYDALLARGVGVVTASKLAPAAPRREQERLLALARQHRVPYLFETTVGAALPFLHALEGLRLAGDRVLRFEAVLSGSLSLVLQRLGAGQPFSAAVREAHAAGFTEPHPWDDLSAEDVARKLVILARAAGAPLDREEVRVEPLVAPPAADEGVEAFLDRLRTVDAAWGWRAAAARAADKRLVPLARWDERGARFAVEAVPVASPFARLGAGENLLRVESARYGAVPLSIAGPGAGPEVTAGGVLADVVVAARRLARAAAATPSAWRPAPPARHRGAIAARGTPR